MLELDRHKIMELERLPCNVTLSVGGAERYRAAIDRTRGKQQVWWQ